MENLLTTAELAVADMILLANDFDFTPSVALACQVLTRKTIAAKAVIAPAEKALEVTGGAGIYRKLGLERLLPDVHGVQFQPLPHQRPLHFPGRVPLGLDPARHPPEASRPPALAHRAGSGKRRGHR